MAKKVKSKEQLQREQLLKVIKTVVNHNTVLPILEDVYVDGEHAIVTDLETECFVPFKSNAAACIPSKQFLDAHAIMQNPELNIEYPDRQRWDGELAEMVHYKDEIPAIEFTNGKKRIKITGDNPMNFPRSPISNDFDHIGDLSEKEIGYLETALKFVSTDDLRPAMTGVFIGKQIAATNAHQLYFQDIEPLLEQFILPRKAIQLLSIFGGDWQIFWKGHWVEPRPDEHTEEEGYKVENGRVYYKGNRSYHNEWMPLVNGAHVAFINSDNVIITTRTIDAQYPDYLCVIPRGETKIGLIWEPEFLSKELQNAVKFANRSTNQVTFNLNGKVTIHAQDVDFGFEYDSELEGVEKQGEIEIAFNAKLLDNICKEISGEPITMKFWSPTKATVINERFLLMPLMLNS